MMINYMETKVMTIYKVILEVILCMVMKVMIYSVGNEDRDRFFCGSGNDKILDFDYPLDVKSNDCEEF